MLKIFENPIIRQYVVVIVVNLSLLTTGLGLAWPSPVLVKLNNATETVLSRPITTSEGSWIVSIGFLVSIFVTIPTGFLIDNIGRKYSIIIACIPKVVASFLLLFATEVWMMLTARALIGISDGVLFLAVPLYASEVSSKEIRGALGTVLQVMCSIGVVSMMSMGPFLSYVTLNIIYTFLVVTTTIPLFFIPESPYFLYAKGRPDESQKVLTFLRNSGLQANEEVKEFAMANKNEEARLKDVVKNKIFLKSLAIAISIGAISQLIGFNAVSFYLQTILESTQTSLRSEVSSVVVGCIQLTASICTILVTDRFGRKPILTSTLIGMAIGMVGLGSFFVVKDARVITGALNYLPLVSLVVFVFCYSGGVGSVMWSLVAEIFDDRFRSIGMTMSTTLLNFFVFIITIYFAPVAETIGPAATYFIFSVNCVLSCLFIMFCVPETKGKSFAQIQRALGAKDVREDDDVKC